MAAKGLDLAAIGPNAPVGQFLRSFWQPVYLSHRLSPGKARPLRILGEDFTLYRGEDGTAHMVAPRCAHRGLKLSVGRVEGDCIRCFYHGWKYDADGRCVDQPAEKKGFADKINIPAWPVREYLGLIFAYLGPGKPPPFPEFDAFGGEGFPEAKESRRRWSFFSQLENSVDESHFNFVHARSKFTDVGLNDEIPDLDCEETEYGILRLGKRGNAVRRSHILIPNCMYSMVFDHVKGWSEHLSWRVPVEADEHISYIVDFIHKTGAEAETYRETRAEERAGAKDLPPTDDVIAQIFAGDLHIDDVPERPDIVLIQDAVAMMGQDDRRDRSIDNLGASDKQVALLRRIWNRETAALAAGKPIKAWRIPPQLIPTRGTADEA
jgi:5,5'-dehydrodivanillate O-demethylase